MSTTRAWLFIDKNAITHTYTHTNAERHAHIKAPSPYVWETERPSPWKQTSCSLVSHQPSTTTTPLPNMNSPPLLSLSLLLPVYMLLHFSSSVYHSQHHPSSQNTLTLPFYLSPLCCFIKFCQFMHLFLLITMPYFIVFYKRIPPFVCVCVSKRQKVRVKIQEREGECGGWVAKTD